MSTVVWIVIAVVVVVLIAGLIAGAMRQRSQRLKGRFGGEYDRTLQAQGGNRFAAERELSGRMDRRKKLDIVPLSEQSRQAYLTEWRQVQAQFVDAPADSVAAADGLVRRVMQERGYPMGDFEQRAADISVDHAGVVDHYRAAHGVSVATSRGDASTEDQRQAMVHYRALFEDLLGPAGDGERNRARGEAQYAGAPMDGAGAPPPAPRTGGGREGTRKTVETR